jgi:hypothetical protein
MYNSDIAVAARVSAQLVETGDYDPARWKALIATLAEQLLGAEELLEAYHHSIRQLARSDKFSLHGRVFEKTGEEPDAAPIPREVPPERDRKAEERVAALRPARQLMAQRRRDEFQAFVDANQSPELKEKRDTATKLQEEIEPELRNLRRRFDHEVLGVRNQNNS